MNEQRQNKKLKNKNKSKERRAEQKAEAQRIKNGHRLVKEANAVPDPLEKFPSFQKFERNGLTCRLMCRRVTELNPNVLEWAIDLCKRNMKLMNGGHQKHARPGVDNNSPHRPNKTSACGQRTVDSTPRSLPRHRPQPMEVEYSALCGSRDTHILHIQLPPTTILIYN
ncbi:hypothetical protein Pcinc_012701 [Petrolisthes cinctipes]|uniref:Uncharacterized protein n=1 Tax=Petrolisthes cinctipes TaxID=88211 RepID=A0AAE1G173_PETCI|nr:hypothetical protein Pcinc_012701 [Petrolisthes cinctipes]